MLRRKKIISCIGLLTLLVVGCSQGVNSSKQNSSSTNTSTNITSSSSTISNNETTNSSISDSNNNIIKILDLRLESKTKESIIYVHLESLLPSNVVLKLYDNSILIGTKEIIVNNGKTIISFDYQFQEEGTHLLSATLESKNENDKQNGNQIDTFLKYVNIDFTPNILLVDGTGFESGQLYNLLSDEYDVTQVNSSLVSSNVEDLKEYSEIVLMNVSVDNLPSGFDVVLDEYISEGGNVLTTGGENTYYYGGMENTKFDDFLPINVKDEENPIAVMLLIDASSSMSGALTGSFSSKMEIAKDAAIQSVNALRDIDYVGVIAFSDTAKVIVPMTSVTQRQSIIDEINKIQQGTATNYVPALMEANNALVGFNDAEVKHIIFASDGESSDLGYNQYIASMYEKGITTTTIGIGTNVNDASLGTMADIGHGNFYSVTSAFDLSRIMVEEIENLQTDYLNVDTEVTPRIINTTTVVKGISSLPDITGYIKSTAKDEATVVLQANSDPLYAQWDYGEGTVASFMSDLKGTWTQNYFTDPRGQTFIKNIIYSLC